MKTIMIAIGFALAGAIAGGFAVVQLQKSQPPADSTLAEQTTDGAVADSTAAEIPNEVSYPQDQWSTASIELKTVQRASFTKPLSLTGTVSLNQDRIAHIYPIVDGTVDQVSANLGQQVKSGELLAVIHSREIGDAKLKLYQVRLQQEMAAVKDQLQQQIAANASELIEALRDDRPIYEIESLFRSRSMGDYRERLLAAYSNFLKSQADVNRLESVSDSGAVSGKQLLAAKANLNADRAVYQSRIEQIEYEIATSKLLTSQALKEAETQVAVAATSLRILGCSEEEIESIDPAAQGETISHYSVRAPLDGTVIMKHVVLKEQVRPEDQLLSIADLSTVWITADVYEENVSHLTKLVDQEIRLQSEAWPGETFTAKVFYAGDIMDEATRTISMRAVANNDHQKLKPGMFVSIHFDQPIASDVIVVPLTAIQEYEGKQFVFLHAGDGQFVRREITVGEMNPSEAIVRDGLQEGDSVVVQGGFILKSLLLAEVMGGE